MRKRLLCITPDLSLSGAAVALLGLIRILVKPNINYDVTVMSYGEGNLKHSFIELLGNDHLIVLNGLNPTLEFRRKLQNEYDIILLNTVAVLTFSFYYQNTEIPVYWWIHEAPELIEESFPAFVNPHLLSPNFKLLVSSAGSARMFSEHYLYDVSVLPVPVYEPETISQLPQFDLPKDRTLFLIPAAYTYIKGQDILLSAILSLPEEYVERSYFIFCGYSLDKQAEYRDAVIKTASRMNNVLILDKQPQDIVYALMNTCNCVIAPSRIDTIPLSIVEAMMYHKISLVSSQTGISYYIQDCVNGFVFNDQDELIKRLLLIINDPDALRTLGDKGHKIYSDIFSPDAVESVAKNLITAFS